MSENAQRQMTPEERLAIAARIATLEAQMEQAREALEEAANELLSALQALREGGENAE